MLVFGCIETGFGFLLMVIRVVPRVIGWPSGTAKHVIQRGQPGQTFAFLHTNSSALYSLDGIVILNWSTPLDERDWSPAKRSVS